MEAVESPSDNQPNLNELAVDMFQKSAEYIEAELAVAQEDYKLLTDLNRECDMTYAGLRKIGGNLNKQLKDMTEKHAALKPYLEMIDSINESTSKLEAVAYMMDTYSKRLEQKFKTLEKR
ncbi:biogenesis of lysosome-related organelles complex 1 subunit 2 [Trichonephila clavipes]|nr:biogenesis of lysosome-related organelles complex 1 subunit 2 [Trichonephila clavipes]